jgi:predicted dehydrogenase
MSENRHLRVGVVGVGSMGGFHARELAQGLVARAKLAAVCDVDRAARDRFEVPGFEDSRALLRSGLVDAVMIATPHYDHTPIAIEALGLGLHVLCEKPLAVHKADCEKMIAAYEARPQKSQVFAEMFQHRTDPPYRKLKEMITSGELGEIRRINWIVTDWFRTEAYYRSGGWRATWRGEGGGVLLNQCPHNLDLWQWMFGLPSRVRGFCRFGRFHDIEVEDEVTAYLEYDSGATAVFVTTTGEAPGTNRLEVAGERGKVVLEGDRFSFTRNEIAMSEYSRTTSERFTPPPVWNVIIPMQTAGPRHRGIWQNFVNAVFEGEPLIAPAVEGIRSVELGNSILHSAWTGQTVTLPLDAIAFQRALEERATSSRYQKPSLPTGDQPPSDITKSF